MWMRTTLAGLSLAACLAAGAAGAGTTFNFVFSGAGFGNSALETGTVTIAADGLGGPVERDDPILSAIVTVTGDGIGDGVYTTADYAGALLSDWSPVALNLGQQLVGQSVGGGCAYGAYGLGACGFGRAGDFNFLAVTSGAPNGAIWFANRIQATGHELGLTSLTVTASAPEPVTWALMLLGFAGMGAALRSRRGAAAAVV